MNAWTLALAGSLKSIWIPCSLQKLKSFSPTTQKKWDFSLIRSLDSLSEGRGGIEIQNERLHQIESRNLTHSSSSSSSSSSSAYPRDLVKLLKGLKV